MAATLAVVLAGCGLGPGGESEGEATLTVTRDYGSKPMLNASVEDPPESETVIRMLDREAEITTRFGGGLVQSIDGVAGEVEDGRNVHWFFYVNGVWSDRGAAEVQVRGGDRIWWDRRDWTDVLRTPAVVGSWPEPFAQASASERLAVTVECLGSRGPCEEVADRLGEEGVEARVTEPGDGGEEADALRLLVGPWELARSDPLAALLEQAPSSSGVFARFERFRDGYRLLALDERAEVVREDGSGAGLVAAMREGDQPPTWLITGTDATGVEIASEALDASLRDRYALFVSAEAELALPAGQGAE
jgi:hypothetical protein